MRISGKQSRAISTNDANLALSYDLDMYVNNASGEAAFGISGYVGAQNSDANGRELRFNLKSGKVFDPEGRYVFSYQKDKDINFKGTFVTDTYDYFIDNNLICSKGSKSDFKVRHFFFDSKDCEINITDLDIFERGGSLALESPLSTEVYGDGGSSGSAGISGPKKGDGVTFGSALTFMDDGAGITSSVLSGEVVVGRDAFAFDNSSTYLADLKDVPGVKTQKDLKLVAQEVLEPRSYDLSIDFYTTFGTVTKTTKINAIQGENLSGVRMSLSAEEEGIPLNSGNAQRNLMYLAATYPDLASEDQPLGGGSPRIVRGFYDLDYSKEVLSSEEAFYGLPYRIYLEHVEGDHSKNYAFITGVEMSGNGMGYDPSSIKSITFRTGEHGTYGTDGAAGVASTSIGQALALEHAQGFVSNSPSFSTQLVDGWVDTIAENLYTSTAGTAGTNGNVFTTTDGAVLKQQQNVLDVVAIVPSPDKDDALTKTLAKAVPMYFTYTKPASDWKVYVGPYGSRDINAFTQLSETGIENAEEHMHFYNTDNYDSKAKTIAVEAKNYVDTDPMVYNLVVSGSDDFSVSETITGTCMDCSPIKNGEFITAVNYDDIDHIPYQPSK